METGQAVVLLNLQNLYESLYDALNQYYVFLGGLKYVDLGLGTHRVKCRVHKDFRLIVIEEKEVVYKQFPIPLINRLEKHYIDINSVLNSNEKEIVKCLQNWVQHFVSPKSQHCSSHKYLPPDVFIGYHSDTCSSVVLQVIDKLRDETGHSDIQDQVLEEAKIVLLNCATPDSVVRLEYTDLPDVESERLLNTYFKVQRHHSLAEFIGSHIQQGHWNHYIFTEVTTFSRLLTAVDVVQLQSHTGIHNMNLLSLRQFETEFSFLKKIRQFLGTPSANKILLLQIDFSEDSGSANILASARYSCMNEIIRSKPISACKVFVYFITKLQRIEGGTSYTGFQGGHWTSVHIDDLRSSQDIVSDVQNLRNISICDLFKENKSQYEEMEVQDPIDVFQVLESMFDTTVLLRSCVQNAVSMLRDPEDGGTLSTRRVEILLRLMDNISFMETLKKRLHLLLKTREDNADMPLNWVTREASNIEALQEGGTFKHALWRRVQTVVTPFLAHLISFIDRNCNLDLLLDSDCKDEVKDMWLLIFGEKAIQNLLNYLLHYTNYIKESCLLQLLCAALASCVNELCTRRGISVENKLSLPLVHSAYHEFRKGLQNFSRMMSILPQVALSLQGNPHVMGPAEMILDVYGALACVEQLEPQDLNGDFQRQSWLKQVKRLQVPIELVCSERSLKHYTYRVCPSTAWRRIFTLSLFVEHILLGIEREDERLTPLVMEHTRNIGRVRKCVCVYGLQSCAICRTEPQDPVELPCNHIFCQSCIKRWLIPGQMYCAMCTQPVPDDFQLNVSEDVRTCFKLNAQFRQRCNAFFVEVVSTVCFKDNSPPSRGVILHLLSFLMVETFCLLSSLPVHSRILTKALSPFDECVDRNPIVRSMVLKLLLKYSFDDVKDYLEHHLTDVLRSKILDDSDKSELYTLYINCFEVRTAKHQTEFLDTVMELCGKSGNDWYRVYLIRKICSLHGVEFVRSMQKEVSFRWLFPQEILQQEEVVGQVDQYLVYGEEYKTVREAIAKAVFEGRVQSIDAKCTCSPRRRSFYILLALFQEVTTLFRASNPVFHPKPEQCRALEVFVRGSQHLSTSEMKAFAEALVNNTLGSLSVHMRHSNMEHTLTELAVHLKAVLLCGSDGLLHPLTQLGLSPSTMQACAGHCCFLQCGQPTQLGRCLECGATVGGQNHLAVHGFRRTQQMGDRTQRGHILGDPQRRDNPEPQSIAHIIRPPVQDPCGFLMQHLAKDLEQLSRAVGKGADETVTAAHLLLSWALEPPQSAQWTAGYDNTLSTKEARNAWEVAMAQNIITPKLKKLERKLQKVGARMRDDSRVSSDPILKLMYGDPRLFLSSVTQSSVVHSSAVWSCREGGSLLSLMHVVEQNDGKDNFPLLWRFLQKEPELRLVRFLPDILALQRNLVKKFQNLPDLISGTIRDFLDKQNSASLKSWYLKRIQIFLNSWNQLRTSLVNFEVKVPDDYCSIDLDEGSELQVLVPRRQGAGLCATALLSYLISLHNQLVSTAEEHTGEDCSYKVSLAEVSELHVIGYEVERDLLPLVVANCQYSVERGRETLSEYDLPKIQQQVLGRLLRGKPQITLAGIPTLVSRQDRNYENIFKDIREKVTQEPLMPLISSGLVTELQGLSDVCEALGAIEVALGFLAMTGGDEHMPLEDYLERRLWSTLALGRCCLNHCVALWQLLTSLKSEHMLRLKRDPFSGIPAEYQQALGDDAKQLLSGFLSQSRADAWLLEMHEFLLLCLKSQQATDTFRPDWSLKDTLVSYMERKNLDIPLDVEAAFPDQIQLSQLVETWKFTITHKQQR
uniref:RING-type domain-containing protein n=1 Tax=Electrophorus electricus TaxID=8005 RepID=A0A4W4H2I6_ELEEL